MEGSMTQKEEWIAFYITRDDYSTLLERDKLSAAWDAALKNPEQKILPFTSVKCTKSTSERYTLREKSWWADIMVSPDGFVNIQSDYGDYHYRWGSFGDDIKKFLISCDKSYLYNKFGGLLPRMFNQKKSIERVRKDILEYRRNNTFNAEDCREFWDKTETLKIEHISSTEEWSRLVSDSDLSRMYDYDMSNIPCTTEDNYQLTAFLTIIWPEFTKILKNELGI
jgi:hypothetical protein